MVDNIKNEKKKIKIQTTKSTITTATENKMFHF